MLEKYKPNISEEKQFTGSSKLKTCRVLAFTCSKNRPFYIQSCIQQMQNQTHPIHHCVFINSDMPKKVNDPFNYLSLIHHGPKTHALYLGYGKSKTQHENHMTALSMASLSDYDLFCKIDDDDIYSPRYIEDLVNDYLENKWDFSGSFSNGLILNEKWQAKRQLYKLGEDIPKLDIPDMMPGTYAFSKKAMTILSKLTNIEGYEDPAWRKELSTHNDISIHFRINSNYVYNIHGKNISTFHHG